MPASPVQLKGSFRGVPFGTYAHSMDGGRRTVTHEFPFKDVPFTEDLGLRVRSFSLDLFVLGDDSAAQRDALRNVLEQKGPGTLVHPYLGTMIVQVSGFTLSESINAQRMASFSVSFVQPGKIEFPSAATNPVGTISSKASVASLHAGSQAGKISTTTAVAHDSIKSLVESTVQEVQTSAKQAAKPNAFSLTTDKTAAINAMSSYVRDLATVVGLLPTPDLMSFVLSDAVFRLSSLGMPSFQAFGAYRRLLWSLNSLFSALHFPNTLAGATMLANAGLFRDSVYTSVVGSAATSAVDAEFTTLEQAIATRNDLAAMFDLAMAEVNDDTLFGYLQDLRAESLTQIPPPGADLPSIVKVRVPAPLPSLVLAHDLMSGSIDEQRLIQLNAARNPWFMPNAPGTPVLILR